MRDWGYPRYISKAEKQAKAARKLLQLKKKNPAINPISLTGNTLARTWWGKSWNRNLERYADYHNRIGRGRSYVRHGAVLDLQILPGEVRALVQGSQSQPYSVTISIRPISSTLWREIRTGCEGMLESLGDLLAGKFPKALGELFMAQGHGLFPTPEEISFDCSCPDWASMCKHVASTLYGVGARLDEDPTLFFTLRKVKQQDLITQAVRGKTKQLLDKAEAKSKRIIAHADLSDMFGIELEETADLKPKSPVPVKKARKVKKQAEKRKITTGSKTGSPAKGKDRKAGGLPQDKTTKSTRRRQITSPKNTTEADQILHAIKRSRKGIDVPALRKKTGIDEKKIRNIIASAYNKGVIKRIQRGLYRGV